MVVAQLLEWSLQTPEVHGSNLVIDKIYMSYQLNRKVENIKKQKPGIFKKLAVSGLCRTLLSDLFD